MATMLELLNQMKGTQGGDQDTMRLIQALGLMGATFSQLGQALSAVQPQQTGATQATTGPQTGRSQAEQAALAQQLAMQYRSPPRPQGGPVQPNPGMARYQQNPMGNYAGMSHMPQQPPRWSGGPFGRYGTNEWMLRQILGY